MSSPAPADSTLRDAHRQRVATQLPNLGLVVTGAALGWFAFSALDAPLPFGRVLAVLAAQAAAFGAASIACRRDPLGSRVIPLALATCLLVGWIWIVTWITTAKIAVMLTFGTLTLFTAAPIILVWGVGTQLVFQGGLTLAWLMVAAVPPRQLPFGDIVAALGFSNCFALLATHWATRSFHGEVFAHVAARDYERRLAASRDAYRALAENALDFMSASDLDGRLTYVNEALARRCGRTVDDMTGRSVAELLTDHPENPDPRVLIARLAAGEILPRQLFQLRTPEGACWVETLASLIHAPTGAVIGVQGVSRDVTQRREAEEQLRASEHRFRTFAESMATGVLIAQAEGIRYANAAVTAITGYTHDELLHMRLGDLVHPDDRHDATERIAARLNGESLSPRIDYRLATKSGESRWGDITATRLMIDGEPAILGTAIDITERKIAEEALRASEARYRGLVESQREVVLRFDADGTVTFANDAYCDTYGVAHGEAIGNSFWPLVHPEDAEALRAAVAATLHPPYRVTVETRSRTSRDGWRWFEWEASAVRDGQGTMMEGQATGRDVTERRRTHDALAGLLDDLRRSEEKLRLLTQRQVAIREEERKRLSYDLHDDVCQELVGVGILVEAAAARLGGNPPQALADLGRATGYLREVVDHLRNLARDLRPIMLHELGLEGSLRSLAAGLIRPETTVQTVFPSAVPRLDETVEVTVYRIAQEAITNAIRHAAAREVTVTLGADQEHLYLEVGDDGRGFDVEDREAFALGLASMKERAQAISAVLTIRSAYGTGTTVRLECPVRGRSSASAA